MTIDSNATTQAGIVNPCDECSSPAENVVLWEGLEYELCAACTNRAQASGFARVLRTIGGEGG